MEICEDSMSESTILAMVRKAGGYRGTGESMAFSGLTPTLSAGDSVPRSGLKLTSQRVPVTGWERRLRLRRLQSRSVAHGFPTASSRRPTGDRHDCFFQSRLESNHTLREVRPLA